MKIQDTGIFGVYLIENFIANDERGSFIKTFNALDFSEKKMQTYFKETYYSISNKNVVRGMHFQTPPFDHEKLVTVLKGSVIDVVLDIRKESSTYGKTISFELNDQTRNSVYIPTGCAHGFYSLEDGTTMLYQVADIYNQDADAGILWNSLDFNWPIRNPILSKRDSLFPQLSDYESPF